MMQVQQEEVSMPFLGSYLATAIVIAGTALLVVLIRLVYRKTLESTKRWPYQRQLLIFLVFLIGLFLSIALLPLDHEIKMQILSVLGLLLSAVIALSSTTLVSNAMAGIMLRMTHEFRGGDFIEVDDLVGRVTDLGIFHTEIQLVNRDVVSLPNLFLAQKSVKVTRRDGTFLNISLSIGYTVSHQNVEQALLKAASQCKLTDSFVFIEAFLDHAIRYRLYGMLDQSAERLSKTSELYKTVLDVFVDEGIEIASPSLSDRRELDASTRHLPSDGFRQKKQTAKKVVEDLVFDKAEEAQSIEDLKQAQAKLSEALEKAPKKSKGTIERKMQAISEELENREEKRKTDS
jgi:small-conductance mechanosensitive channel